MKSIYKIFFYAFLISMLSSYSASAQLLKKLGQKIGNEAGSLLDKNNSGNDQNNSNQNSNSNVNSSNSSGSSSDVVSTSSTGRKKMKPPDVKKLMADAETAYNSKDYDGTRYNIEQAEAGIELEIGYQILDTLPKSVNGQDYKTEDDQVIGNGYGFAGFDVERSYYTKDNKTLDINIMNNSAVSSGVNMMLTNPMYMNSSNNNTKAIQVGDYRAVLTAEDDGSFTLSIPLGQSSVIIMKCGSCKDEDAVTQTAGNFNIDLIKTLLGEQ